MGSLEPQGAIGLINTEQPDITLEKLPDGSLLDRRTSRIIPKVSIEVKDEKQSFEIKILLL